MVYKDFPLKEIHPWAERAAIDSGMPGQGGRKRLLGFCRYVHANGREIQGDHSPVSAQLAAVDRITLEVGKRHSMDAAALESCVKTQSKTALEASVKEADALGVESTPEVIVDGMKMEGAVPENEFRAVLDKELKDGGMAAPLKTASSGAGQK